MPKKKTADVPKKNPNAQKESGTNKFGVKNPSGTEK